MKKTTDSAQCILDKIRSRITPSFEDRIARVEYSPVSGRIVKTRPIDGTYCAQTPAVGFDLAGPNESQGYIAQVASWGLIFIEADNPKIGLMAVMFVGMAEVSTNDILVYEGQHVNKGDPLGMFHFGGSTDTLIFRPQVKLDFGSGAACQRAKVLTRSSRLLPLEPPPSNFFHHRRRCPDL
jgi:hypothetical protein